MALVNFVFKMVIIMFRSLLCRIEISQGLSFFFLASLILLGGQGCQNSEERHSTLFQQLFPTDTAAFRGIDPRDSLWVALRLEDEEFLKHKDELGLSYKYLWHEKVELLIDYHSGNLKAEQNRNQVASIVANVMLNNEVESAKLYKEAMVYFNRKYGVSSGTFGNLRWEGITRHLTRMDIYLRMHSNRRGLTLNFVDTEPNLQQESFSVPSTDSVLVETTD